MTQQDPVLRYAAVKSQMKLLENELKFLQPEVLKRVQEQMDEDKKVTIPTGYFKITETKVWSYSPDYQDLEHALDERKKMEQATGLATFVIREGLMFKENGE